MFLQAGSPQRTYLADETGPLLLYQSRMWVWSVFVFVFLRERGLSKSEYVHSLMAAIGWGNNSVNEMLAAGHEVGPMFNPSNKTLALMT